MGLYPGFCQKEQKDEKWLSYTFDQESRALQILLFLVQQPFL